MAGMISRAVAATTRQTICVEYELTWGSLLLSKYLR